MITLHKTKTLMERSIADNLLDTYAVIVRKGAEKAGIFSANADENTLFDAASVGKVTVTGTLVLRAVGEGKISLEDTLPCFFANVPEDKKSITVKQLLAHSSGIVRSDISKEILEQGNDAIAAYILSKPLAYQPGKGCEYSCFGYLLLACIIEQVYKNTLDNIYFERYKKPLGFKRMGFGISPDTENAARTHFRKEDEGSLLADDIARALKGVSGNGCSFWSAAELSMYADLVMQKDARLYADYLFELAEQNYTPFGSEGRGLGYAMFDEKCGQSGDLFPAGSFGHVGITGSSMIFNRELDLYVIVLTNATRFSYIAHDYKCCDMGDISRIRSDIHNAIKEDLGM